MMMKRGCLNFFVDEACDNLLPDDVTFVKELESNVIHVRDSYPTAI